jgi:hypothetical protein
MQERAVGASWEFAPFPVDHAGGGQVLRGGCLFIVSGAVSLAIKEV